MDTLDYDSILEHYGIKGMKWGVRRSKKQIARDNARRAEEGKQVTLSKDAKAADKAARKAVKKGVSSLSNEELKVLNERLNLERNFERLTSDPQDAAQVSAGRKAANFIAKETGQVALNVARNEAQRAIQRELRKQLIGA